MNNVDSARAAGQRAALITAALGLVLALLLAWAFGLATSLRGPHGWIVLTVAVFSVLGFARTAGGAVGVRIKNGGNPWLHGIGLALATVLVPTVAISLGVWAVQYFPFADGRALGELGAYVLKPLFWILAFGAIPACVLGLIYARLVSKR